jgi:hypothetical protein
MPFSIDRYAEVFALWQQCEGIGLSDADSESNIQRYLQRNPGMSFITMDRDFICFIYTQNKNGIAFWESAGWTFRTEISLISRDIGVVRGDC